MVLSHQTFHREQPNPKGISFALFVLFFFFSFFFFMVLGCMVVRLIRLQDRTQKLFNLVLQAFCIILPFSGDVTFGICWHILFS